MSTNALITTFATPGLTGATGADVDGIVVDNIHTYYLSTDATAEIGSGDAVFSVSSSYRAINIDLDTTSFNGKNIDIVLSAFSGYSGTAYDISIYNTNTGVDLAGVITIAFTLLGAETITVYPTLFETSGSNNTYHIKLLLFNGALILDNMYTLPGDTVLFA